jgi:hypothetical protein
VSPTEHELRAALRQGEGPALNPDHVVAHAEAARRQQRAHRQRVLGGVAAAVVVAGIGVGISFIPSGGKDEAGGSKRAFGAAASTPQQDNRSELHGSATANGAPTSAASSAAQGSGGSSRSAMADCPPKEGRPVDYTLPSASLFSGPVRSLTVCAYGPYRSSAAGSTAALGGSTTFTGNDARAIATDLDGASSKSGGICPQFRTADEPRNYLLIPVGTDGKPMEAIYVVIGTNPCQDFASNGSGARFRWAPPEPYAAQIAALPVSPDPGGSQTQSPPTTHS